MTFNQKLEWPIKQLITDQAVSNQEILEVHALTYRKVFIDYLP